DRVASVEMCGDLCRRAVVERAQGLAIGSILLRDFGRHGIEQRQLLDSRPEMLGRNGPRVARVAGLGQMGDDVGFTELSDGIQREPPSISRSDPDADETACGHIPSLPTAFTTPAVL